MLLILLATTGLILLIACANVANLTLARLIGRDRELAVRAAMGAARGRLVRQLLTESTLLSLAGGVVGLLFAASTISMLTAFVGRFTSRTGEIGIDPWVLGFTLLVSIVTGVVFGTFPALTSRVDLVSAMKQGARGSSESLGRKRLQGALIVAQVAVSVVLLVGAGLLMSSFYRLQKVDAGYQADRVLSAEAFTNFSKYPDAASQLRFYQPVLERLEAEPGVVSVAVTNAVPLSASTPNNNPFDIEGRKTDNPDTRPSADVRVVTPNYFMTLGIPLVQGRAFNALDRRESPAMVHYWDKGDPVGSRVSFDNGQNWATVVGVVGDVRQFGLEKDSTAQVYAPLSQSQGLAGQFLVRTNGDPLTAAKMIREDVHAVDPNMPIENVQTLDELRDKYLATPKLTATLLMIFAGLALLVTMSGISGVIATSVNQRMQEFGVRMALGSSRNGVLGLVLRQGLALVVAGLAIGGLASVALTRVLSTYLFDTKPTDPITFAAVSLLFVVAGAFACLGPAWRATRVDPMLALRAD